MTEKLKNKICSMRPDTTENKEKVREAILKIIKKEMEKEIKVAMFYLVMKIVFLFLTLASMCAEIVYEGAVAGGYLIFAMCGYIVAVRTCARQKRIGNSHIHDINMVQINININFLKLLAGVIMFNTFYCLRVYTLIRAGVVGMHTLFLPAIPLVLVTASYLFEASANLKRDDITKLHDITDRDVSALCQILTEDNVNED